MIRVKYDHTCAICHTGTSEIWALGGDVYVAIPIQDRAKAEAGGLVRIRALTADEARLVAEERARVRAICHGDLDHKHGRVIERLRRSR